MGLASVSTHALIREQSSSFGRITEEAGAKEMWLGLRAEG